MLLQADEKMGEQDEDQGMTRSRCGQSRWAREGGLRKQEPKTCFDQRWTGQAGRRGSRAVTCTAPAAATPPLCSRTSVLFPGLLSCSLHLSLSLPFWLLA